MKQPIDKCLAEYTSRELAQFHANLHALELCCNTDFHLMPLLMQVHFALSQRKDVFAKKYLLKVDEFLNIPTEYK